MVTFTPLQMVVAGVSANESTLYISGQNAFTNFTVGTLPSSPFTEPIASPGSRITHIAYYFGKLFWWKDQSFGYASFTNQFDWQVTIVSNQIGTLDNSDAFWNSSGFDSGAKLTGTAQANAEKSPGGIFFRGQDNHIYVYDGYYLTRLSRVISPTVATASRRKANSWTQTGQSDFNGGSIVPAGRLSTSISPGDVIVSSFQAVEASSTQWASGASSGLNIGASSITLTLNSAQLNNNSFESGQSTNWTAGAGWSNAASASPSCGTINPQDGSKMESGAGASSLTAKVIDSVSSATINTTTVNPCAASCSWVQQTLTVPSNKIGYLAKVVFNGGNGDLISDPFVLNGNSIQFYTNCGFSSPLLIGYLDNVTNNPRSSATTGWFTSQVYDSSFSSATYQLQAAFTANTSTPSFALQTGTASNGPFVTLLTSTGTNGVGNRYSRYTTTFSLTASDYALTSISSITILARSTGTYYSAVDNAPNLTTWGTFSVSDSLPGNATITYFTRSSTNSFTVGSATPSWISQTKNANVAASTGTYFQMRADFAITAATEAAALSDFTFNWFEGSASDKAYITYFNDAIWFSVSNSSSVSTNNRVFYWDILNGAWLIYDIPSNGFLIENNSLYFGDPIQGRVFKFGSVTTDNASAINSYWRSKSFLGTDPFVQNEFQQADFVLAQASTTVNYTYTLDSKSSTIFAFTTYDSAASLIQRNFLLPIGKIGKYYDFKVGNNDGLASWRLMAHKVHFNFLNWKPVTQ